MPLRRSEINRAVRQDPGACIRTCCDSLSAQVRQGAEAIRAARSRSPIVLLSGPTASGKTTLAGLLAAALEKLGVGAHVLSLDNYFLDVTPELTPRDEQGNYDFESPLCLDLPLLQRHFDLLSQGEGIDVPAFDFVAQARRSDHGTRVRARRDEVVIFEGIHALGPEVSGRHGEAFRAFVSVGTDILDDAGEVCMRTDHLRLLRRIVRDHRSRGASPAYTLELWDNVRRYEKRVLLAQRSRAELVVDSLLAYEPGVLRTVAMPLLQQVSERANRYRQIQRLIEQLKGFEPVAPGLVPEDALTREFIGGGLWG